MTTSELRINNYVLFSEDSTVFVVNEVHESGLEVANEYECIWIGIEEFEPIPLTEEWLVKFGFEFNGGMGYKSPDNTAHWFFSIGNGFTPAFFGSRTILSDGYKGCKYVHQLQNLYFALTGTELTQQQKP